MRRRNSLSASALGELAGIGAVVSRWERFYFNPFPTDEQLKALAIIVGVESSRLREMLPNAGETMNCKSIRLCGACYAESPCHQIQWQYRSVWKCDRHQLKLLSKCPACGAKLQIPALWKYGCCHKCHLSFREMMKFHKPA